MSFFSDFSDCLRGMPSSLAFLIVWGSWCLLLCLFLIVWGAWCLHLWFFCLFGGHDVFFSDLYYMGKPQNLSPLPTHPMAMVFFFNFFVHSRSFSRSEVFIGYSESFLNTSKIQMDEDPIQGFPFLSSIILSDIFPSSPCCIFHAIFSLYCAFSDEEFLVLSTAYGVHLPSQVWRDFLAICCIFFSGLNLCSHSLKQNVTIQMFPQQAPMAVQYMKVLHLPLVSFGFSCSLWDRKNT